MSIDTFFSEGKEWITDFVSDMPSIHTENVLRFWSHRNRSYKWELNDLRDSDAMRAAVPYCDIVVTERHATHVFREAKLHERYGTDILNSLTALESAVSDRLASGPPVRLTSA